MSMTWFKLHHEIIDDIKIRRFTPQEKWAWIVLLSLASKSSDRGIVEADSDDLADYCEFNCTQDWLYYRDKLIAKGMLEINAFGSLAIVHWNDRQSKKPSDDPARVKDRVTKSRAKKKSESASQSQEDVSRYKALQVECNADVSPQIRSEEIRSEEIRSDQFLIAKEKKITTPCEIEISLPEEKKEYPTFEKKSKDQNPTPFNPPAPLARNYSQQANDRIMQMRQSEKDKWVQSIFDCRLLSQNDDFVDFIQKVYLPTVPDNRGKKIEITQAQTWIVKGQRDFARRDLVEIQIKAFEKYEQSQTQKQHEPAIAEQVPIISAPVPINVKEYAANLARKSL